MKFFKGKGIRGKTALMILAFTALLPGCTKRAEPAPRETPVPIHELKPGVDYEEGKELLATVGTLEDAERLEELYGIELVEFGDGLAVFHTEENPAEVVRRGEQNGWPALEVNHLVSAFD